MLVQLAQHIASLGGVVPKEWREPLATLQACRRVCRFSPRLPSWRYHNRSGAGGVKPSCALATLQDRREGLPLDADGTGGVSVRALIEARARSAPRAAPCAGYSRW